jgi:hypothetical protein
VDKMDSLKITLPRKCFYCNKEAVEIVTFTDDGIIYERPICERHRVKLHELPREIYWAILKDKTTWNKEDIMFYKAKKYVYKENLNTVIIILGMAVTFLIGLLIGGL